ncbi:MAG: hypothetical protein DCF16_07595 [Alphaproteobacteria bacterium]|nr:MAG: hypothetical protein DCF16_07595 [Alphaproteobacteria bacterium]
MQIQQRALSQTLVSTAWVTDVSARVLVISEARAVPPIQAAMAATINKRICSLPQKVARGLTICAGDNLMATLRRWQRFVNEDYLNVYVDKS